MKGHRIAVWKLGKKQISEEEKEEKRGEEKIWERSRRKNLGKNTGTCITCTLLKFWEAPIFLTAVMKTYLYLNSIRFPNKSTTGINRFLVVAGCSNKQASRAKSVESEEIHPRSISKMSYSKSGTSCW